MAFTGQSRKSHIMAGMFSMDNLYLTWKTPLLVWDMLVNFGDILPETSKSRACWDMGGNSHLRDCSLIMGRGGYKMGKSWVRNFLSLLLKTG